MELREATARSSRNELNRDHLRSQGHLEEGEADLEWFEVAAEPEAVADMPAQIRMLVGASAKRDMLKTHASEAEDTAAESSAFRQKLDGVPDALRYSFQQSGEPTPAQQAEAETQARRVSRGIAIAVSKSNYTATPVDSYMASESFVPFSRPLLESQTRDPVTWLMEKSEYRGEGLWDPVNDYALIAGDRRSALEIARERGRKYAVVVLDGDNCWFQPEFMRMGRKGGAEVVRMLKERITQEFPDVAVRIMAFASLRGFKNYLARRVSTVCVAGIHAACLTSPELRRIFATPRCSVPSLPASTMPIRSTFTPTWEEPIRRRTSRSRPTWWTACWMTTACRSTSAAWTTRATSSSLTRCVSRICSSVSRCWPYQGTPPSAGTTPIIARGTLHGRLISSNPATESAGWLTRPTTPSLCAKLKLQSGRRHTTTRRRTASFTILPASVTTEMRVLFDTTMVSTTRTGAQELLRSHQTCLCCSSDGYRTGEHAGSSTVHLLS